MQASLKPISDAGVVDTTAADRGPHGLADPKAIAWYRERLVALDGREVKVINLDNGAAVGTAIARVPVGVTGMTVLGDELIGVSAGGNPIRISAFEARTGADAPEGAAASGITDVQAVLSWDTERGYRYQLLGGGNRSSWASGSTPFTFTGLTPNTRSPLAVRSLFQGIGGSASEIIVLTLPDEPDVRLHGTTATSAEFATFDIETGERIEMRRRLGASAWSAWTPVTPDETTGRFSETGLVQGGNYVYQFRARNDAAANAGTPLAGGISPRSTEVDVNTSASQPVLLPGTRPVISSRGIAVSLTRVGSLEYEYRTSLNPGPDASPTLTDMPANGEIIAGFTPNTENWIEYYSRGANNVRSAPYRITFLTTPLPPTGIGKPSVAPAWAEAGDLVVTWTAITGLTYFGVHGYRFGSDDAQARSGSTNYGSTPPAYVGQPVGGGAVNGVWMRASNARTAEQRARGVLGGGRSVQSDFVPLTPI